MGAPRDWCGLHAYSLPCPICQLELAKQRLQMIADAAKDGASLTWIRAVAEEGLRGEPLVGIAGA